MDLAKERAKLLKRHRDNNIFFWMILAMGILNVSWLIYQQFRWDEIVFRGLQYVAMLIVLRLPQILKLRLKIEVPYMLSIVLVVFSFSALILGDGMDLYGRFWWWDKLLHAESGIMLSMIALWLIHITMAENDKYIYLNKYFLSIFLIMFSVGLGACWEILEYSYDSIMGTNTQQFMASTTGSIISESDIPLCGHAALRDTMQDLILDFCGAFGVAVFAFIRHNKITEKYKNLRDILYPENEMFSD